MITSLFASILAIVYFKISFDTVRARRKFKISMGPGPNNEIQKYISAHSNFAAYTPILLILTYLLESSNQFANIVVFLIAATYTIGRVFHYMAFAAEKMNFNFRLIGMVMTFMTMNILAILNIIAFLKVNFL